MQSLSFVLSIMRYPCHPHRHFLIRDAFHQSHSQFNNPQSPCTVYHDRNTHYKANNSKLRSHSRLQTSPIKSPSQASSSRHSSGNHRDSRRFNSPCRYHRSRLICMELEHLQAAQGEQESETQPSSSLTPSTSYHRTFQRKCRR